MSRKNSISLASQLEFATSYYHRLYGNDIEICYESLKLLIAAEGNQSKGENLVSSEDDRFVSVRKYLLFSFWIIDWADFN